MTDYGKVRGMRDVTDAFATACQGLASGQVLKVNDLTMMDAMNALTMLDPRMDTGCLIDVALPGPSGRAMEKFELWERLLPEEVCAIMDKLTACEMSYHSGRTLVTTIFPSLHLLSLPLLREPPPAVMPPNPLLTRILRPYLLALHLCLNLSWHELIRGNVYDGEDFSSDTYGVWENGREWEVYHGEEVPDVTRMMDEGEEWLIHESGLSMDQVDQLITRLRMRKNLMFHLIVVLSGGAHGIPISLPPPLKPFFQVLASLPPIPTSTTECTKVTSSFDWNISRRYRQTMPVASFDVLTQTESLKHLEGFIDGLETCSHLAYEQDLSAWDRTLRIISLSSQPPLPIIRSCIMATLNPTPHTVLFGYSYPTTWMSDTWLCKEAGLAPGRLAGMAIGLDEKGEMGAAKGLRGFLDRLAGTLINDYSIMCQNRSRQRRFLLSSALQWEELYSNCPGPSILSPPLFHAIRNAIARHRLDRMIEGVLAGLDLELIDEDEWLETFWWVGRLAQDRNSLNGSGYKHEWAEAWAAYAKGMVMLLLPNRMGHEDDRTEALARAKFGVRFKWACVKPFNGDADFSRAEFDGFRSEMDTLRKVAPGKWKEVAVANFARAAVSFRLLKRYRIKSTLPSVAGQAELTMLTWLAEMASQNQSRLTSQSSVNGVKWRIKDDVDGRYRFWCPAVV